MTLFSDKDPLSIAWAPPANETPEEKAARLEREAAAQRVSDAIDESLKAESAALKKRPKAIKLLLLGQSESGKSTLLKNLQMTYAPKAWEEQRASWRSIIQLNLIRSVNFIVDILSKVDSPRSTSYYGTRSESGRTDSPTSSTDSTHSEPCKLSDKQALLRLRLGPLRTVEEDLRRCMGITVESDHFDSDAEQWATPFDAPSTSTDPEAVSHRRRLREFFVRVRGDGSRVSKGGRKDGKNSNPDEATGVIASCAEDIKALWEDERVQALLAARGVDLRLGAGFFLDDIDRIAVPSYVPSDSDVVRARLRTVGVQEHRLVFEDEPKRESDGSRRRSNEDAVWMKHAREWIVCDVGGCRSSRHAWLPYLTDLSAILFLAPVSCFDENLAEDPEVNRLDDSITLWTAVVKSPLLAKIRMFE
ncbi:hypothetical protein EWM64_g1482 [Hericium alpestre]|uniref:Uncharacterized protein n=1 Tax=Hericium alpestre TaxID=135208 RepID=A0A4Z0A694_9AGAM|nr:hypothetical protein EWM64_g1482 [Hericium alpestre]